MENIETSEFEEWVKQNAPELSLAWSVHKNRYIWSDTQKFFECWRAAQRAIHKCPSCGGEIFLYCLNMVCDNFGGE